MNALLSIAVAALALAQPFALQGPGVDTDEGQTIEIVAVHGLTTGQPSTDPALRPLARLLESMPHDTFRLLTQQTAKAPMMQETEIVINDEYSVHVLPLGHDEEQQLELQTRVTQRRGGRAINALVAEGKARPGRALLLRGLEMPGGELGIVLRVVREPGESSEDSGEPQDDGDEQSQDSQSRDDNEAGEDDRSQDSSDESEDGTDADADAQEQGDAEDREQGEEAESDAAEADDSDADEEQRESGGADGEPQDLENIEALLQSLEDQDRREQRAARNRRDTIRFNTEWW